MDRQEVELGFYNLEKPMVLEVLVVKKRYSIQFTESLSGKIIALSLEFTTSVCHPYLRIIHLLNNSVWIVFE
jgi:hypothetical protein